MKDNKFYVYEHWRPDKDECFYVGKGSCKRAYHLTRKESVHHNRIVKKLGRLGLCVEVRLVSGALSEKLAFALEIQRIAFWKNAGVPIVNKTIGGEGASGCKRSDEFKQNLRTLLSGKPSPLKGRQLTIEHRSAISVGLMGRQVSNETRDKISASQKGKLRPDLRGRKMSSAGIVRLQNRVFTTEHRARISAAKRGKPQSPEHKAALASIRAARRKPPKEESPKKLRTSWCKGRKLSAETCAKMSAVRIGKKRVPMSEEQKEKLSIALTGRRNLALKGKSLSDKHVKALMVGQTRRRARERDTLRGSSSQQIQDTAGSGEGART